MHASSTNVMALFSLLFHVIKMYTAGPPTITFITTNTTVFEGDKVQLVCGAVNDEDALYALQIIWYKRSAGITIPLSEMPRCYNDTCNNGTLTKQLLLDPVSHYDAGEYICRAFNHHQSYTESTTFLTVECKFTL